MSGRFVRQSAYRHVRGDPAKPEKTYADMKVSFNGDGNYIAASDKFFAYAGNGGGGPVHIINMAKTGRVPLTAPRLVAHKSPVTELEFSPFASNVIATGSDDGFIKITQFPEEGLTADIHESQLTLEGHMKKITQIRFHPTARDVLSTGSADNTIRLWDLNSASEVLKCDAFGGAIQSYDFNTNGSLIAATSQDKLIRVFDPRNAGAAIQFPGLEGTKPQKCVWADNVEKLIVVGSSKASTRQYALFDPKKSDKPLVMKDIDQSAGVLVPFFDADNSILYLSGKGDAGIKYLEVNNEDPFVHFLDEYRDSQSQKGVCWLPKRALDTGKCEIARALRLLRDCVVPISFTVPRKSEQFQSDLFPDAYAGVPAMDSKEYFAGTDAAPVKQSLKPGAAAVASAPTTTLKAKPSYTDLESALETANLRIKELEELVAKLQA